MRTALAASFAACTIAIAGSPASGAAHHFGPAEGGLQAGSRSSLLTTPGALSTLLTLPVTPRDSPTKRGYERAAFGSRWSDVDGNGCNQRDDVLLRDAVAGTVKVARQGRCPHDVIGGTWVDPYSGRRLVLDNLKDPASAQAIQIDHVVPLAEAWISGAAAWSDGKRRLFANDLDALLAVDGVINARKGDGDPAAWRPKKSYQCEYARRWIGIKARWELSLDASERRALVEMISTCTA